MNLLQFLVAQFCISDEYVIFKCQPFLMGRGPIYVLDLMVEGQMRYDPSLGVLGAAVLLGASSGRWQMLNWDRGGWRVSSG